MGRTEYTNILVVALPVHVPAGEEFVEIVVERDTALGGLYLPPLLVLVPYGGDFRLGMLFGLRGVVFCVYVPEAQDCYAEHQRTSSTISSPGRNARRNSTTAPATAIASRTASG